MGNAQVLHVDSVTGKPRESDLLVEHSFPVQHVFQGPPTSVRVRLFIECKYVASGAVFWVLGEDADAALNWVCTHTPLIQRHAVTAKHHYLASNEPVAKLFASEKGKEDNDPNFPRTEPVPPRLS